MGDSSQTSSLGSVGGGKKNVCTEVGRKGVEKEREGTGPMVLFFQSGPPSPEATLRVPAVTSSKCERGKSP